MFIAPTDGLLIPDPSMRGTPDYFLPTEGREVEPSEYWTRRLRDGDVHLAGETAPPAED
jgi:hypothetical protein